MSTVSHELRTPLTSICGSLGLLMGTAAKDLPERTVRLLSLAQSNSERLVKLVNDILDIEKLEAGQVVFKFKLVELRPLIEQVVDANRGFADTYLVRLRLDIQGEADVWADPDRLSQVVTNLISNAIKFSPPDGEVVVAVKEQNGSYSAFGSRPRRRHSGRVQAAHFPKIRPGRRQQHQENRRHRTGPEHRQGDRHPAQRNVGFADAPGGGTVFYVDLPCVEQPAVKERPPQAMPVAAQSA